MPRTKIKNSLNQLNSQKKRTQEKVNFVWDNIKQKLSNENNRETKKERERKNNTSGPIFVTLESLYQKRRVQCNKNILRKYFPSLLKDINLQSQEAQQSPINKQKSMNRYILIKLQKTENKKSWK